MVTPPVALTCGPNAVPLPPPATSAVASKERALLRSGLVGGCANQPSVEKLCDCLVKSFPSWGKELALSTHVECSAGKQIADNAQLVEVVSKPEDADSTARGVALLFAGKDTGGWSARGIVEHAPDVDLTETPKTSDTAAVDDIATHATSSGTLYLLRSHEEAHEKSMGDSERDGQAHATVCSIEAGKESWCSVPLLLGRWSYTFAVARPDDADACTATAVSLYSATVDPSGVTMKLEHGPDTDSIGGRYTF